MNFRFVFTFIAAQGFTDSHGCGFTLLAFAGYQADQRYHSARPINPEPSGGAEN